MLGSPFRFAGEEDREEVCPELQLFGGLGKGRTSQKYLQDSMEYQRPGKDIEGLGSMPKINGSL